MIIPVIMYPDDQAKTWVDRMLVNNYVAHQGYKDFCSHKYDMMPHGGTIDSYIFYGFEIIYNPASKFNFTGTKFTN